MGVFINEFHYDNSGADSGEFVEVAGTAGTDLGGYTIYLYNGANGQSYAPTITLSGIIPDQGNGVGTLSFPAPGLQNGSPDGLALVQGTKVLEFLSYEGTFTAANGPAAGLASTDVGVSEPGDASGTSIARVGTGNDAGQFSWALATDDTPGGVNQGQTFAAPEPPAVPFINEFHYDNAGADAGEFVEVAAKAGTDLSGYSIVLYNGANGQTYTPLLNLSGVVQDQGNGYGTLSFAALGLQNGAPDGLALVKGGEVIEFLSYEGTFTATNGPAAGLASTDVGVSEPGDAGGTSIARVGTGTRAADFTWALATDDTPGGINQGQTFGTGAPAAPAVSVTDISFAEGNAGTKLVEFTVVRQGGQGAFTVDYATADGTATAGSDYAATSGTLSFAAGQTEAKVQIAILGDTVSEPNETFALNLFHPTGGAVIGDAQGVATILNDETAVAINDVSVTEGDNGQTLATFTLTRTGTAAAFSVDYATANGTATAGSDYVATGGTVTFGADETVKTLTVAINGDTQTEPNETFSVSLSGATNGVTIADGQGIGTITNDDISATYIHDIQGSAFFSPILAAEGVAAFNVASAQRVTVQAVVTAIDDTGARQGFFIAEEQGQWDNNPFTSEGIFVMTRNDSNVGQTFAAAAAGLTVGETVTISAQVMEYQAFATQARTFLVNPVIVAQGDDNVALPTLVLDGSAGKAIPNSILTSETPNYLLSADTPTDSFTPDTDALDFLETIEGMRVTIPNMVAGDGFVGLSEGEAYFKAYSRNFADPQQINSRGGYTIAGDPPLSPPDTPATDDATRNGGRVLHDGDTNPDILELDFSGAGIGGSAPIAGRLSMGDTLGDVTGVFDYDFATPKLYVTAPITLGDTQPVQEVLTLADDARSLRVATFNVENLDPGDGAARFQALANAIANNLKAPDILSIEEIQDNNGTTDNGVTDASNTWKMLVDAVNTATGKRYQWVDQAPVNDAEGGAPGGNIRVGFLYNTDRVQLGDLAADADLATRRQFTDRIGDGVRDTGDRIAFSDAQIAGQIDPADYDATRKSLLGQFTFNGNAVYVIANHLPSKSGGSDDPYQFNQDLANGRPENSDWEQRNAVADDVYRVMDLITQGDANARIVSGGDFNDFYFYRPLEVATGFVNPDGTARVGGARFDNLTVTDLPEAERYTYDFDGNSQAIDHILADRTLGGVSSYDIVHINTGYNSRVASPALSDHDPAVAQFDFRSLAERLAGDAGANGLEGFGGDDTLLGGAGADTLTGGAGDDRLDGGADGDLARFAGARGDYQVARNPDGSITVTDMVASRDGSDRLVAVEQVGFGGGAAIAVDQLFAGVSRVGGSGVDVLTGDTLDDRLYGYANNDRLSGLDGNDSIWGGQGSDSVAAGAGDDRVHGGAGNDMVAGGEGADYLVGGIGDDRLEGGAGGDIFFFARGEGRDTVTDYQAGVDAIHLAGGVTVSSTTVGDFDGNGVADLRLLLTGGGQVTVLGVSSAAQLTILANQTSLIGDIG